MAFQIISATSATFRDTVLGSRECLAGGENRVCGVWCRPSIKCRVWLSSRSGGWRLATEPECALQTRVWSQQMVLDRCFLFVPPIPFSFFRLPSFTCHMPPRHESILDFVPFPDCPFPLRKGPPDPCWKSDSLASAGPAFWAPPLGCPVGTCISAHSSGHPGLKP